MDLALRGKTVLVTGGAKGIGEAIVRVLVTEEAIPVIVDRDESAGQRLCDELAEGPHRCELVVGNLGEPGVCRTVVETAAKVVGRIDALVNNAGLNDGVSLENGSSEEFLLSLRRNLLHYFEMAHFALPFLKESRGAIVNISSKVAVTGQGGTSGYAASKGGILAMTRRYCLALDLKDDPGLIAEYERHHQEVWPEITHTIRESGIEEMEIYRAGNRLFMVMEVSDEFSFEAKADADGANPRVQEWEALMGKFQRPLPWVMPGEKWLRMKRIFKLEERE